MIKIELISATQSAVQNLRDLIITGELAPGQKINETLLASNLGLSRPPLREALRILEAEGLVVNNPRRSTLVSELSKRNCQELSHAREMIECYALDLIKLNKIKDFSPITNALAKASRMKSISDSEELLDNLRVNADFHSKLVGLPGNVFLFRCYASINSNLIRYQFIGFRKANRKDVLKEHHRILNLIEKGDFERAKKHLVSHIWAIFKGIEEQAI